MRLKRYSWTVPIAALGLAFACDAPASSPARLAGMPRSNSSAGPQLLVCPSDTIQQSPTMRVGVLGGTLAFGGSSIAIPPNAVTVPTDFQIVIPASRYMEVEIHAVGFSSFLFNQPAQVTLDYSRCPAGAAPAGAILEGVYVDSTNTVLQQMDGSVDSTADQVKFTTGHLSGYAVAY